MRKLLIFIGITFALASCRTTYVSTTTALENNAYVKVVVSNYSKLNKAIPLDLFIDGEQHTIHKIVKDKRNMKAVPVPTTPGEHRVVIKQAQNTLYDRSLFIDIRETRKIILE